MKAKSLLGIITSSKLPNFRIMKEAYIYKLIYGEVYKYLDKSFDVELNFECYLKVGSKVNISISSPNQYLIMFLKMNTDQLSQVVFDRLKKYGVVKRLSQVDLKINR